MTKYLLDTNTCVLWMRGKHTALITKAQSLPGKLSICSVVLGELHYGAVRSGDVARHLAAVAHLQTAVVSFPFDDASAVIYGQLRAGLAATGMLIGPNDLQIASIALQHNQILVTNNVREFSRVPGLIIEDWQ